MATLNAVVAAEGGDGEFEVANGGDGEFDMQCVSGQGDEVCVGIENRVYSTPEGRRASVSVETICEPPSAGMVFPSWEDLDTYFRRFAKQQGFGIVKAGGAYKQVKGQYTKERRNSTWRCECFGQPEANPRVSRKLNAVGKKGVKLATSKSKKCGCPVMLHASASKEGQWEVKTVVLEHQNHDPTPRKARYISMYRKDELTNAVRRRLFQDVEARVKIPQIHSALASEREGIENFSLTERDIRNEVDRGRRLKLLEGDANAMNSYFKRMSADNQNFFHLHRIDEHERLKDVMWVDARSRAAYDEFGDVVCFDSTYLTNKYLLPFANFVGVNHHGQTILLGCALLSHEDCDTFQWLFSNWMTCMGGKAPDGILTDQDPAMRKALSIVMPHTRHRWCLWHILNKFPTKLGAYEKYQEIKEALHNAIYDSLTPEEFEVNWTSAIAAYSLEDNQWLEGLYCEKEMWIPAYMKHIFWAGMKTTQRSESINSFFDKYVHKNTRLSEFVEQYCKAMEKRANNEKQLDADAGRYTQQLVTDFPLEAVFQKIYTPAKFYEVQHECMKTFYVRVLEKKHVDGEEGMMEFTMEDFIWVRCSNSRKDIPTRRKRLYNVKYNSSTNEAWCMCKLFECTEIICRHIIEVYDMQEVATVPDMYILRRWRKDVQRKHTRVKVAYHDPSKTIEVKRYDKMMVNFEPVCLMASVSDDEMKIVIDTLYLLHSQLNERHKNSPQSAAGENYTHTPSSVGNAMATVQSTPSSVYYPHTHNGTGDESPSDTVGDEGQTEDLGNTANVCDGDMMQTDVSLKDPMSKAKPHRTTDKRYLSCLEKVTKPKKNSKTSKTVGGNKNSKTSKKASKKSANKEEHPGQSRRGNSTPIPLPPGGGLPVSPSVLRPPVYYGSQMMYAPYHVPFNHSAAALHPSQQMGCFFTASGGTAPPLLPYATPPHWIRDIYTASGGSANRSKTTGG